MIVERLLNRLFGGHLNIGPVTIYGRNAMHWAVNIRTRRWGYICFRLPLRSFGCWWPMYLYFSPNATPWASTLYLGDKKQGRLARIRREEFGHGFDTTANYPRLRVINGYAPQGGEK